MAEVIYPRTSGAFVDANRFTVLGDRPGPAGISSITLPHGIAAHLPSRLPKWLESFLAPVTAA